MALLPQRHPNKDFFVLDISDIDPKDDAASMEHPIFSLATKPDMRHLSYINGDNRLEIIPSGNGLPTIFDKDILIFCISQLVHRKNQGMPIGKTVRFNAHELLIATNRPTNNLGYKRLEAAISRLRGTTLKTNINYQDGSETRIFGFIDSGGFVEKRNGDKSRLSHIEITLSDFTFSTIENMEVLSIHEGYFRLRRPLERRLYELCRKHCGKQKKWEIRLSKLQEKTGSNSPLKRFRHNIRQIIAEGNTPFYSLELSSQDKIIVRPRKVDRQLNQRISIPVWAEEKAHDIASQKGWDYYALEKEWINYATDQVAKGNPPKDFGAAFIGYCKGKQSFY